MGEGEMTQLVPVRWLVLAGAGAGWAVRLQITDSRSGAGDGAGDAAPLPGDWGLVLSCSYSGHLVTPRTRPANHKQIMFTAAV